ncbi:MAG: hypothetical protein ABJN14_21390 [Paracoccaceae bacterium]
MKLTLDWNCVIEVEENRPQSTYVKDLINRHKRDQLEVALLAASASENSKSLRFPGNASLFDERVSALGWQDLPLVPMPCVISLSYIDFCYIIEDADVFKRDIEELWQTIAPNVPSNPIDHLSQGEALTDDTIHSRQLSKWRNTWCDVVSAYSHIQAGRDVFVTRNTRDFQDNAEQLSMLGMRYITTPKEAVHFLQKIHLDEL